MLHTKFRENQSAGSRPATFFFVKKPKIFENVKSERAAANFHKSQTLRASTIISKKFSDLRHKKHVCWINHFNEHDTTLCLSDFNESEIN